MGLTQLGVDSWLSALIVAVVTATIGYVFVNKGLTNLRRADVAPIQAIESIKETTRWTNKTPA
jgi:hypothetical protein